MKTAVAKIRRLLASHWEAASYLFFGVLTTVINYGTFWIFHALLGDRYDLFSNLIAFVAAVTFAYITNKLYVFESRSWSFAVLRREIPSFLGARLVSFGFEEAGLFVASYLLHLGQYVYTFRWNGEGLFEIDGVLISKLFLNVIVVIMNYFFSKFFIFKKQDGTGGKPDGGNAGKPGKGEKA